jgi:hypothetical protein
MDGETPVIPLLLDSGMFTQVEHDFQVKSNGYVTLVNRSRGVIAKVRNDRPLLAEMHFDKFRDTYYYGGRYNAKEIEGYILPVMRDDKKWDLYSRNWDYCCTDVL